MLKKIGESIDNVTYMENSSYLVKNTNIRIIGATLWSFINEVSFNKFVLFN